MDPSIPIILRMRRGAGWFLTIALLSGVNSVLQIFDAKIRGIEGMKYGELDFEIQRGAKFVLFQYCISVVVLTFRRPSDIYFLRQGENAALKGLPFALLSLVAGWWASRGDRFTRWGRKAPAFRPGI
jgi:hypothetical protein